MGWHITAITLRFVGMNQMSGMRLYGADTRCGDEPEYRLEPEFW